MKVKQGTTTWTTCSPSSPCPVIVRDSLYPLGEPHQPLHAHSWDPRQVHTEYVPNCNVVIVQVNGASGMITYSGGSCRHVTRQSHR